MYFNLLSTVYAVDTLEPIVKWLTIGFVIAIVLTGFIIFFTKKNIFADYAKKAVTAFVLYATVIGIIMLILEIVKHYNPTYLENNWVNKDIVPYVFIPILITLLAFLISAVILLRKQQTMKKFTAICGIICGVLLVYCIISIALFFTKNIKGDGYYTDGYGNLNGNALYGISGIKQKLAS